ncbi:MAG: hypothetical protein AAGH15_07075 [Myxococcota bacterium]
MRSRCLLALLVLAGACHRSTVVGEPEERATTDGGRIRDTGLARPEDLGGGDAGRGLCPAACQDERFATSADAVAPCDCCPADWWVRGTADAYVPSAPDVRLSVELDATFADLGASFVATWGGVEATGRGARVTLEVAPGAEAAAFTLPGADSADLAWVAVGQPVLVEVLQNPGAGDSEPRLVFRVAEPGGRWLVAARDDESASTPGSRPRMLAPGVFLTPNPRATCTAAPSECWTFGVHGAELSLAGARAVVEAGETAELVTGEGERYAFRAAYRLRCCAEAQCADSSYSGQGAGWMVLRAP